MHPQFSSAVCRSSRHDVRESEQRTAATHTQRYARVALSNNDAPTQFKHRCTKREDKALGDRGTSPSNMLRPFVRGSCSRTRLTMLPQGSQVCEMLQQEKLKAGKVILFCFLLQGDTVCPQIKSADRTTGARKTYTHAAQRAVSRAVVCWGTSNALNTVLLFCCFVLQQVWHSLPHNIVNAIRKVKAQLVFCIQHHTLIQSRARSRCCATVLVGN